MRTDKRASQKADKKTPARIHKRGVVGYSKKSALLEEAITHMHAGKYGRSSASLKELLALDPHNTEARRLFATLHLKLGSAAPFSIISGYRSPETNSHLSSMSKGVVKNSMHLLGKAIDIRLPGHELKTLQQAAVDLRRGGVGYYPSSDFVHVDVGRVRYW